MATGGASDPLVEICVKASTDPGDLVWEPFGGLCSAAVVSHANGRACRSAEVMPEYYRASVERLKTYDADPPRLFGTA